MRIQSNKKDGYIGGVIFLLLGIIFLVTGYDQGWDSGKLIIILGLFFGGLGGLGIVFPEIGEIIWHYMKNLGENNSSRYVSSRQHKPKRSPQATGRRVIQKNTFITNNYGSRRRKGRKR